MPRQRIHARTSALDAIGRALIVFVGLILVWYGLMLVLLAVKVDPGFVDSISGYRTVFDYLAGLTPGDFDSTTRLITAGAGVLGFLLFGYLAIRAIPRPYLARHDLSVGHDERGTVVVEARALERLAEVAACAHPAVASARARNAGERVEIDVTLNRARELEPALREIQGRAQSALVTHDLPSRRVDVTLRGIERKQRRELE